MKFERVDDKTVRCFISNEELADFQIEYKDFVMRSEKAREIVRDIVEQATEAVGYKPPQFAFDMSIMMQPDQGVVLTLSESDPMQDNKMNYASALLDAMRKLGGREFADGKIPGEADASVNGGPAGDMTGAPADSNPILQPDMGIFEFGSLHEIIDLAAILPANLRVKSELYHLKDRYYLYLQKGAASYARFSRLCVQTLEFSSTLGADEEKYLFLKEHARCLIPEKALKALRVVSGKKTPPQPGGKKTENSN